MLKSNDPSVVVRNVAKTYWVTKDGSERGLGRRSRRTKVEALKACSFVTYKGESIGILGRNGSGKSTLLSLIAGNESLTEGSILVSDRPSLLSVSAALQPHLSGLENAKLGLLAKGFSSEDARKLAVEICEWAELGASAQRSLRTYSSGMGARLKFAISTAVKPEILLVDEALATGDAAFNAKAQKRMQEFLEEASTVFMVSHSSQAIVRQCTRAIWLHDGELIADGEARTVAKWYKMWSDKASSGDRFGAAKLIRRMKHDYNAPQIILDSEAASHLDGVSHAR